jgi:serine/threonine protein kinase
MSASEFDSLCKKLVARLASGQIDRAEYEAQLAELQRHYGDEASTGRTSAAEATTDDWSVIRRPSVGDIATVVPAETPFREGYQLDHYQLQQRIGRGGMGEVWKAWDTTGERPVVIKLLPRELQANADEMERVRQSFQRVHALHHEQICPTHQLGRNATAGYYLVMKFIDGGTLAAYRRAYVNQCGNFPLAEVARLLRPVASALDYAHKRKVVHRDIKPQNIMVSRDGQDVQIVDFGLAAQIRTSMTRVSQVQMDTSGTYPYMAPEQWKGEYQDGRTDQYALGIVAYELLAGRLPYDAADPFILRQCALQQALPTVAGQPAHVADALAQATAKTREARFATCMAFVDGLAGKDASQRPPAAAPRGGRQPRPLPSGGREAPVAESPTPVGQTPARRARPPAPGAQPPAQPLRAEAPGQTLPPTPRPSPPRLPSDREPPVHQPPPPPVQPTARPTWWWSCRRATGCLDRRTCHAAAATQRESPVWCWEFWRGSSLAWPRSTGTMPQALLWRCC